MIGAMTSFISSTVMKSEVGGKWQDSLRTQGGGAATTWAISQPDCVLRRDTHYNEFYVLVMS